MADMDETYKEFVEYRKDHPGRTQLESVFEREEEKAEWR